MSLVRGARSAGAATAVAQRSAALRKPSFQATLDKFVLTPNNRGVPPKKVPSQLNGMFETFISPYEQNVMHFGGPQYLFKSLTKKVTENVFDVAPGLIFLGGVVWYANDYVHKEQMEHRS